MQASMSRRGNCYDNAPMESFWGSLKNELVHHCRYATRAEAEASIREFIEIFYNRQRRHSRLGYIAPAVFAQNFKNGSGRLRCECLLLTGHLKIHQIK
jgi:transposase InsO family protein